MHWAADLIGKPWAPGCSGPDAFDCWGLVRWVFKTRHGIDMPLIALGDEGENVAAIKRASQMSGWRRAEEPPMCDDIVLMNAPSGRHVGVMIDHGRGVRLLHSDGLIGAQGMATGAVSVQRLSDAIRGRYKDVELWRRACT